ncbi:autoinducer binding domain-containing protein [Massilia sp. WF1]|uniref:autoinducer binding domain-containing protein n=1 Tax=Massilia sp. WF1 TaxID=1406431 RepID=UPI0009FC8C2A|nr:autoinducer binding domain-containing protein [Massilia sp. WF1]
MLSRAARECDYQVVGSHQGDDFGYLLKRCRDLGFDYCATGIQLPLPVSAPKTVLENNYSAAWQAEYARSNYLANDPTIPYALITCGPVLWSHTYSRARPFWEDAAGHGVEHGVSIAMRHHSGALGMLSLARGHDKVCHREFAQFSLEVIRLGEMFAVTKFAQTVERLLPESIVVLTAREKEVLKWTADGKTSEEAAGILNKSVNTVNFHIKQTLTKLNAVNKTQAVVKALILKLL